VTGIEIPRSAEIGPGILIHHFGGIVIHPLAKIGRNLTIRQGVTIGSRYDMDDVPIIGNDVTVGAYGQILGEIHVGDGAKIGALSLVISDISPHATAVGIPAREIIQ
jgi:serine O-acetyltransferase